MYLDEMQNIFSSLVHGYLLDSFSISITLFSIQKSMDEVYYSSASLPLRLRWTFFHMFRTSLPQTKFRRGLRFANWLETIFQVYSNYPKIISHFRKSALDPAATHQRIDPLLFPMLVARIRHLVFDHAKPSITLICLVPHTIIFVFESTFDKCWFTEVNPYLFSCLIPRVLSSTYCTASIFSLTRLFVVCTSHFLRILVRLLPKVFFCRRFAEGFGFSVPRFLHCDLCEF